MNHQSIDFCDFLHDRLSACLALRMPVKNYATYLVLLDAYDPLHQCDEPVLTRRYSVVYERRNFCFMNIINYGIISWSCCLSSQSIISALLALSIVPSCLNYLHTIRSAFSSDRWIAGFTLASRTECTTNKRTHRFKTGSSIPAI